MNVFQNIPKNFFNYLAGNADKEIYSECLFVIYHEYDHEISYRLPRIQLRDALANYLLENNLSLSDDENKTYVDKASEILRKFCDEDVGWLEEDNDDATFEKYITMTEKGTMLVEFLERLTSNNKVEYSFYISNIYNAMKNPESWTNDPYIAVLKLTYINTKDLSKSLKQLSTSIKKIIEEMTNEQTFESLTNHLMNYFDGEFIREYSRLTTQQNIHLYRGEIIKQLNRMLNEKDLLDTLILGYELDNNENDEFECEDQVVEMITSTKHFLEEDYDRIIHEIKRKINLYLNLARARAMFLRNQDTGMKGYVEQALQYMIDDLKDSNIKDTVDLDLDTLFRFDKYEFIDTSSIRYPSKISSINKINEDPLEIISQEDIDAAIMQQKKEAYNPYSKEKMKAYVERLLNGRSIITSKEFPLNSKEDLLAIVAASTYANDNGYKLNILDGYFEYNQFLIREFEIIKEVK